MQSAELTAALRGAADSAMEALAKATGELLGSVDVARLQRTPRGVWDRPGSDAKLRAQAEAGANWPHWPLSPTLAALPHWQTLAAMLLTGESGQRTWRKPGDHQDHRVSRNMTTRRLPIWTPALRRQRRNR